MAHLSGDEGLLRAFRDGIDVGIREGVTAVVQPGGSERDFEVIEACNQADPKVSMAFTGQRAFRAQSQAGLIAELLSAQPESAASLRPGIPPALDHLAQGVQLQPDPQLPDRL